MNTSIVFTLESPQSAEVCVFISIAALESIKEEGYVLPGDTGAYYLLRPLEVTCIEILSEWPFLREASKVLSRILGGSAWESNPPKTA